MLFSSETFSANSSFDGSVFNRAESTQRKTKIKMDVNPSTGIEGDEAKNGFSMDKINTRLEGYTQLIGAELDLGKRADMYLSRAVLHLQKAHALGSNDDVASDVRKNLDESREDALAYIRAPIITPSGKAYALYILGLVHIEKSLKAQAADYFEQSLQTWGDSSFSSAIVFYLGNYLEDSDQASKAINVYQKFEHILSDSEKALAQYKSGWANISLRHMARAEEIFSKLIKNPSNPEVAKSSVKDLAYVVSETKSESGILQLSKSLFSKSDKQRLEFLSSAYSNLQRNNPGREYPSVFAALLMLAGTPEHRLALWISELKSNRQEFASRASIGIFHSLQKELDAIDPASRDRYFQAVRQDVDIEVSNLIRGYIDTYTLRTRNQEGISKSELMKSMIDLFQFFDLYFPNSPKRMALYQIWFDLCAAESNYDCLVNVSNNVLKEKKLNQFSKRAQVEKIIALNALSKTIDKKYKAELITSLERYVENRGSPRWSEFADLLAGLYVADKKFEKALSLEEEVYRGDPGENSFYKLQLTRFKAEKFEDVIAASIPEGIEGSARIKELNREASLKLAIQNDGSKGDFSAYEKNINRFLQLNEDKEKEALVLAEYLKALIRRGNQPQAIEKLATMDPKVRSHVKIIPIIDELMQHSLLSFHYDWILKIIPESDRDLSPKVKYLSVVARLVVEKVFDRPHFSRLQDSQKTYLFQLLSLVSPEQVIDYLVQFGEGESKDLRRIGALAYQVKENAILPSVNQSMRRALGDQMPDGWMSTPLTASERQALKVFNSVQPKSSAKLTRMIKSDIAVVRKTRSMVANELHGKDVTTRIRVLETLQNVELRVAESVLRSPIPPGLKVAQKKEYLSGLEKVAQEFREQANQYELVLQHDRGTAEAQRIKFLRQPASVSVKRLALPKTKTAVEIAKLAREQGVLAALVSLDVLKESQKISKSEFFHIKVGLLLLLPPNAGRLSFSKNLLSQEGMTRLLSSMEKVSGK